MADQTSFKERVKNTLIYMAPRYKYYFVNYEYLLCSKAFIKEPYYIVSAHGDNFRHLTGVNSSLRSDEFYEKALDGTLTEEDFDFIKRGQSEEQVKGSVRRKINVLPDIINIFSSGTKVYYYFTKNRGCCYFAAGKFTCTLGFSSSVPAKPMSLLKGNELDSAKSQNLDLVLRRPAGEPQFNEIIVGNNEILLKYLEQIRSLLSDDLLANLAPTNEEKANK
ncbi:MAG: PBECR4 domain-containing protein [Lachnospiraceae bacterium]|nr:PBECR4 domain-containing protein [Lachnospiraceae bacterium]